AVQAQIARNMLTSGNWVTARLDGVIYLEKSPLIYWLMAVAYKLFGVYDWAARIPIALSCIGLWLFTRILIPDVMLTFTVALAMWAFLRCLEEDERHPRAWAAVFAASLASGFLLKSMVGVLFPIAAGGIYLVVTRQL